MFEHSDINADETNILIAHQFVTGSETSGSESSLGTLDNVEPYVFEPFDYVALGHIHGKQIMGQKQKYCLLWFADKIIQKRNVRQQKMCDFRRALQNGKLNLRKKLPVQPLHDMRIIKGTLRELAENPISDTYDDKTDDYVFAELTDENPVTNAFSTLENIYPNIMGLEYVNRKKSIEMTPEMYGKTEGKSNIELFSDFYKMQNGKEIEPESVKIIERIFKEIGGVNDETD